MPTAFRGNLSLIFLLLAVFYTVAAQASTTAGWKATVSNYRNAPHFLITVDKEEQQLRIFERKSPLVKVAEYTITTGQHQGDKLKEGDMKTPEGVYFVVKYINSGLNYTLYGNEAYPLNYPNPVDRLRKKTGYGIWIHGKGVPIVPYDSNGCVGMRNQDIARFKTIPLIGQPVTLALDVVELSPETSVKRAAVYDMLAERVEAWAKAWSARSPEMFDFYNQNAYSLAQEQSFKSFRAQKEHLFKVLPWINTQVSDIQVLEGPGYWVTWFNQNYEAPNLRSRGTRRLYWQEDVDGQMRIVGMEWLNGFKSPALYADAGSNAAASSTSSAGTASSPADRTEPYKTAPQAAAKTAGTDMPEKIETNVAQSSPVGEFIDKWHSAWKNQDIDAYMRCYADMATQDQRRGKNRIMSQKKALWGRVKIVKLEFSDIRIEPGGKGMQAVMLQTYQDSAGYSDMGRKTLFLEFNRGWQIIREEWSAVN